MSSPEQQLKSEKSTEKKQLPESEKPPDTEINVWHIPPVIQQLRALQELVDKDELRAGCYQESLITPTQRDHLATIPTNRLHNEKLVQFLEAGNVFSFNGFIKVLKKDLPGVQQHYHQRLSRAALAYVDRIQHAEEVQCLVRVKDGEKGAPTQLEIDKAAVKELEVRYLFVSQYGKLSDDNATAGVQDSPTAQESSAKATDVPKAPAVKPRDDPPVTGADSSETEQSGSPQGQKADLKVKKTPEEPGTKPAEKGGSSDGSEELDTWLKADSTVDKENRIMDERLSRRIILLAGDFDIIVKDLSSRRVATQKSLAKLTTDAEESGIYCLTPAAKTKPIYMILKLKRQTSHFHTRILRLALEMSRHLVVYHGETKLMAGKYFNTSQAQQRPGASRTVPTSASTSTVHGRDINSRDNFRLDLDDQSVDVLQILHSVLVTYPLTSRIDLNHRSVHLHCVLDVPHEAAQRFLGLQCGDYCKKLFGIYPRDKKSGKPAPSDAVLGHFPRPPILEEPTIQFAPTFNVTEAHWLCEQVKVANKDPDPLVDQMWLYSMCGLIPRPLLTCMAGPVGGRCILVTEGSRARMDRHARKSQESSNADDVLHDEQQWQGKWDEINFGLLERVLSSWKGAVQITTVLAGKDDKWTQEFLHRQAGLPFFSSPDDQKALQSVMVAWRFSQALNLLRLFLVFTDPVPTVASISTIELDEAHRRMSRLVYASTAVSNICILPDSSAKDGVQSMLQMYMKCLNSVVGEHLRLYEDVKESREKEILSGTLLVSGERGDDTTKELTDRYLCHVVYLDRQSLESATDELLASHSKQHMYASGPKCLDILKLIVFSINEENFNNLSLQDLYLTEYKSVIRKLNKVARDGSSGSRDKSVSQGKELAFTVEVGWKFAFSVSGYETMSDEDFMKVERGLPKQRRQHAGHQDETVRIDLRKTQLEYHREFVRTQEKPTSATDKLCQAVLEKHGLEMDERIEVVKEWVKENINGVKLEKVFCTTLVAECHHYIRGMEESKQLCLEPCSYNCDYLCLLPAGHPVSEDTEADDNGPRGDLASGGASADSEDSSSLAAEYAPGKHDCHPASEETKAQGNDPRGDLASGGASAEGEHLSSFAAEYAPRKHNCLLCAPTEENEGQHKCNHDCELCTIDCKNGEMDARKDECCFNPGHQLDGNDGENIHLCMTREELDSKGKHRCKQLCAMAKARGCKQQCQELKMIPRAGPETSHDICDCLIGKEKHLCDEQCNLCDKRCERVYKHPGSEAHNCGNVHNCAYLCEEKGVCAVDMQQPEDGCTPVKQNLRSSNGWKRPCKQPIPALESTHDGLHSCVEPGSGSKSSHTCGATCRWCHHFCEEPFGHHEAGSPCATTNHGPVIHSTDRIKLCKGDTVNVDELASREWTPRPDSGVVPESPTTCSTLCSQAGPRHIHLVSTANGPFTKVKHSDFWKEMAFTDPSQGDPDFVRLFDRCPIRCCEGHGGEDTEEVFCTEDALHVPLASTKEDSWTKGDGDFQYTSTAVGLNSKGRPRVAGHRFKCGVPHPCKAECGFKHSQNFIKTQFKNAVGFLTTGTLTREHIPCHYSVGHTDICTCAQTRFHVCGAVCDAEGCKNPCQVLKTPGSDGKPHLHSCVTDADDADAADAAAAKCRVVCEAVYCSVSHKFMDKDTHAKRCQRHCRPCQLECNSLDHFHLQGSDQHSGHHHICATHPCGKMCHLGWCDGTTNGTPWKCAVPLDGRFTHSGEHLCSTPPAEHGCPRICAYRNGSQRCTRPCRRKLPHDPTSCPHNCGHHKCAKPCQLGRCSLDNAPGKCDFKLETSFEHDEKHACAKPPDQHYCKETCQLCTGKCAKTVRHPGTPHNCGKHKCEEQCSLGRCAKESNAPGQCGQRLTGSFKHEGSHSCLKAKRLHYCPERCQGTAGQSQCPKVCSHKMPHTSTENLPHNCGTHQCEERCSRGRCTEESSEPGRCKVKLGDNFQHTGAPHGCKKGGLHYCPEKCQYTDQTQCEALCSTVMSANAAHDVHSCGKHPCPKPCQQGRCSSDSDKRNKCTQLFGHPGLCRCSKSSAHLCQEKCVGCQSGLPLSAGKDASPDQWCAKNSNHQHQGRGGTLHDCQNHVCKERCQSKFRCSEHANPEDENNMCTRPLEELNGGRYGHRSNPELHECSKQLAQHLCNQKCEDTANCINYCSMREDHRSAGAHECSGCKVATPGRCDQKCEKTKNCVNYCSLAENHFKFLGLRGHQCNLCNVQEPGECNQMCEKTPRCVNYCSKSKDHWRRTAHKCSGCEVAAPGVGSVNVNVSQPTPPPPSQGGQSASRKQSDTPVQLSSGAASGVGSVNVNVSQQTSTPPSQGDQSAAGKESDTPMRPTSGAASGVGSVNVNGSQQTSTPPSQGDQSAGGKESSTPVQPSPATQGQATSGKRTAQ